MKIFLLQSLSSLFHPGKKTKSLAKSQLQDHDTSGKQDALDAIDILLKYKSTVHEFTDEIIAFWPLPQKVMKRYLFDDAEQLNDWLDNFHKV